MFLLRKNSLPAARCAALLLGLLLSGSVFAQRSNRAAMQKLVDDDLHFAVDQYKLMMRELPPDKLPRTYDSVKQKLETVGSRAWVSGFYPGTLWYLYEYTKDAALKTEAEKRTALLAPEQYYKGTHDLGFMLYCSYGNGYRLTGDKAYKQVLLNAAQSLSTRFNPVVGCIKSWDHGSWTFPVIIDNMMNLELLCEASVMKGDDAYRKIAETHANTTLRNHFRPDFSTFHVVDYDPKTGKVLQKKTAQGYADGSAWARGQSWGLYGYTMMYRETKDKRYLSQAEHIAAFLLNHPRLPEDGIPYWDYDAPDIPHAYRDVSAGAIMASALLELSTFEKKKKTAATYRQAAEKILTSLSSDRYRCTPGTYGGFLLKHSVGGLPGNVEVDVPLSYADYYFIEALMRYKKWFLK
ncbi:glycoside hydrolase family 88 protein [Compostibacter hankyongensis]|uniref:Glycoside hydrolase family 88 protein n=1 Tax=Compostibacter hankyongensis TaxID=1007089 RepID=A0ABP8FDG1_9BACT